MIFPEKIDLNDLVLCKPSIQFAGQMSKLFKNNKKEFSYIASLGLDTVKKSREDIKSRQEQWEKKAHFSYFLFLQDSLIGYVGIKIRYGEHVGEISYFLDKKYTGKGYITRSISALERLFFEQKGHRCEIFCNETNKKSCAVAERLNYRLDGTMREYELIEGAYQGVRIYSKLSTD